MICYDMIVHVPTFVGNNYFCESGLHSEWNDSFTLYSDEVKRILELVYTCCSCYELFMMNYIVADSYLKTCKRLVH